MAEDTKIIRFHANLKSAAPNWEQEVISQAASIRSRLLIAGLDPTCEQGVLDCVEKAEQVLNERPKRHQYKRQILNWWNGGRVEQSWSFLHEGDLLLLESASRMYIETRGLDDARSRANSLDPLNPVRRRFQRASKKFVSEEQAKGGTTKPVHAPSLPTESDLEEK